MHFRKCSPLCGRQLDRHDQSKEEEPATGSHQGQHPWVTSNRQNWENKDLAPKVTFPRLVDRWS